MDVGKRLRPEPRPGPLTRIGFVRSPWATQQEAPIQGAFAPTAVGTVVVSPEYQDALQDIEGFSHIVLLYWFDRAGPVQMVRRPFLDDTPHGVFSTRHPARPNPIGLTIVRLVGRRGRFLRVRGIDVLDGTPLLDIKPYVPAWDAFPGARSGWLTSCANHPKPAGRE